MRRILPLFFLLIFWGCSSSSRDASKSEIRVDTLSYHDNGVPKLVATRRGDSVLERRTYRETGTLFRRETEDSLQTYFDLHDPDSAAILKDYLRGRWQNLSADTSNDQSSAFYIFDEDHLTFENPSGTPLESLRVDYEDNRILSTESGMTVQPEIASFDTVRVTGYTLVRLPPSEPSASPTNSNP